MQETNDHGDEEARIERALAESQRQERAELHADLTRQVEADQRVVEALATKSAEKPAETQD